MTLISQMRYSRSWRAMQRLWRLLFADNPASFDACETSQFPHLTAFPCRANARPALPQALLADQTDNATGSGRQDSTENQQGWEFAYGERAVLHGGKKVEQAGGDEGEGDSSDPGDSEGASSQNEDEQQDDDGRTQVKVNELSRWRVDGKIQGRVVAREEHEHIGEEAEHRQQIPEDGDSDSADSIRQDQSDGQAEDVVGSLSVNDSLQSNVSSSPLKRGGQSRLEQSDEKEDQSGLRDREAAEGQECFLCGEWGHGKNL